MHGLESYAEWQKGLMKGVLRWFGHNKRMENDGITKSVYVAESVSSRLVAQPLNRWIDSANDSLRKRGLNVGQARRMMYVSYEWRRL